MGSTEQNTKLLISLMNKAVKKHGISHLLIFGDFNFPEINWKSCLLKAGDNSLPANFFDVTQDLFLKQHVDFNTRFREGNELSMLDLIFTDEDYMIENLTSIAPLGKSDHLGLVWTFITYSTIDTRAYGGKRYNYWKVNMAAMNATFHNVKWEEEMETKGVNVRWKYFKLKIEEEVRKKCAIKGKEEAKP